jgi:hypothetical protein
MADKHALGCKDYDKAFEAWRQIEPIARKNGMVVGEIVKLVLDYIYYSGAQIAHAGNNVYEMNMELLESEE